MGGNLCREEVKEEKGKSLGREDSLTSADRIRRFTARQSGYNVLSLARRGLKDIPGELWELLELEKLNLSLNSLKVLPPQLALLSNLVVLNLWGNQVYGSDGEPETSCRTSGFAVILTAYEQGSCSEQQLLSLGTETAVLPSASDQLHLSADKPEQPQHFMKFSFWLFIRGFEQKLRVKLDILRVARTFQMFAPDLSSSFLSLSSLPAEIGELRRLRVLFVYRNRLTEVPEELGACTQLEVLSLANNQLSSLPSSLSNLTRLRKLNLSHNLIAHVPGCVYSMKALVFLDLSSNRLENLAENIQALVELKILIMEGNSLHSLPKALCFLTRLELLNLDFNDIKDVPQEMHQLSRLEKLACHPLDKGLHIIHNPLLKPLKEVMEGGLGALFSYLRVGRE
ncbi:hypothetical protein CRENBAI_026060 [Crenichthys baileyi]|uniref:Leucine-rich repeat-containing protein 30 n=1 Tax=Crenichthys baileyi TaxID=28760 RepID=A0AAV9RC31_9TELE